MPHEENYAINMDVGYLIKESSIATCHCFLFSKCILDFSKNVKFMGGGCGDKSETPAFISFV